MRVSSDSSWSHAIWATGALLAVCLLLLPYDLLAGSLSNPVSEILRTRLTAPAQPSRLLCRKEILCGPNVILRFYADRSFGQAWGDENGPLPQASDLVRAIRRAHWEGLRPEDYHLASIEDLWVRIDRRMATNEPLDPEMLADIDLLLTDAFLLYGSHLLAGRVNPETIQPEWAIDSREADLAQVLEGALATNDIEGTLEGLTPQHLAYARLKKALVDHENIIRNGGWESVPQGPKMQIGDRGPRVSALHSRLMASGDLDTLSETDPDLFDVALERAVRRFQERHGLEADGVIGPATRKALNVPATDRLRQIELNMERWRWLPQDLGRRYVLVNIASYELDVLENGGMVLDMRAVVGRRYRRTPVMSGTITYLEINPYWHIPMNIARRDILPKIQRDPQYLVRNQIRVFESWEDQAPEIRPQSIDWWQVTPRNLSFKFRQDPGPMNALGRLKFMFPNKFSVYLHDTPSRDLFEKAARGFSSGCIRIEKPVDLAEYLLRGDDQWSRERLLSVIDSGETQVVRLPEPIPVHLLYWTAWVDSRGAIHFRDDIYGRDKPLDQALKEQPPET